VVYVEKVRKCWVVFVFSLGFTFAVMLYLHLNSTYNKIDKTETQQQIENLTVANFASQNISQWTLGFDSLINEYYGHSP